MLDTELAYQQVCLANASDQAVVISGESGAGKTESAKMVMSYIVGSASSAGSSGDNIEERLLQSSPILEGSAADSDGSRHRRIVSASVETYLLEKSRVSGQSDGEENFHESLVQQFHAVETSMRTLGYSEAKISSSWAVIAAILELGNVKFVDIDTSEGTAASIPDQTHCILAANLLGVNLDSLVNMLTKRTMKTTKEVYTISLNALDAAHARNAFCKALYANMFADIVDSINSSLGGNDSS
ncbi:XI-2, partial [Symbiodinium microadriaticum]